MGTIIAPSTFRDFRCAEFNGTDEYMQRTGTLSFRSDTAGAWSMWVRIPAVFSADAVGMVGCFTPDPTGSNRFTFGPRRIGTTGTSTYFSFVSVVGGTTRGYSGTTTALTANTWHHVVLQSTGTAFQMYVNGTLQTITQWTGPAANTGDWFGDFAGTGGRVLLGAQIISSTLSSYFTGRLNDFAYVSGRALTSGEVTETYNGGTPLNPNKLSYASDIDAWWRFGDSRDSATTMFDEIGTNDMTLVNMDATNYVNV